MWLVLFWISAGFQLPIKVEIQIDCSWWEREKSKKHTLLLFLCIYIYIYILLTVLPKHPSVWPVILRQRTPCHLSPDMSAKFQGQILLSWVIFLSCLRGILWCCSSQKVTWIVLCHFATPLDKYDKSMRCSSHHTGLPAKKKQRQQAKSLPPCGWLCTNIVQSVPNKKTSQHGRRKLPKQRLIPSLAAHLELLRWGSELQIDAMFRLVKGHGSRGVKGEPNETCLSLQQDMEMDKSHACSKALRRLHPFTHVGFSLCEVGRCHGSVVIITVRRSWNYHLPIGRSHAHWLHTFHVKSPTATSIS